MTALTPPAAIAGQRVIGEPQRLRHELSWQLELADGRRAVLAQLAPELAAEPVLRRRWVADMERVAALAVPVLAPTLAMGPQPDLCAPDAEAPWRVRLDPHGDSLEHVLARAPLPIDELVELAARLADAIQSFHEAGAVLRDLDPRHVVVGEQLWFTEIGQARLAILSSRTASSLLVESSPYVAPEALLQVVVDARADVYSLGVVMWRALAGALPFPASLLDTKTAPPALTSLRAEVPAPLAELIERCIARDPERRPETARDVADALRGRDTAHALAVTRSPCQACGAPMRVGLRLCLACGKQAVQFLRARADDPDATGIVLEKATEDAVFAGKLRSFFDSIASDLPDLNFVVGDKRMYDKLELAQRHALPTVLVDGLAPETATALVKRLEADGFKVHRTTPRQLEQQRKRAHHASIVGVAGIGVGFAAVAASIVSAGVLGMIGGAATLIYAVVVRSRASAAAKRRAIAQLRGAPAALPASDPLVAEIAAALTACRSDDVRTRLEELALLVQRCVDARAAVVRDAYAAMTADLVTDPVKPLVRLARTTAETLEAIDRQLPSLDEAGILRALARCEARGDAPELRLDLLAGLDKLRDLEEQRTRLFGRLLEITSLTRTAVELGLRRTAESRSADAEVALALAGLETGD
jgi:hypothetical protein